MSGKDALVAGHWNDGDEIPGWFAEAAFSCDCRRRPVRGMDYPEARRILDEECASSDAVLVLICRKKPRHRDKYSIGELVDLFAGPRRKLIVYDYAGSVGAALNCCEVNRNDECAVYDYLWMGGENGITEEEIKLRVHAVDAGGHRRLGGHEHYKPMKLSVGGFSGRPVAVVSTRFPDDGLTLARRAIAPALEKAGFAARILENYIQGPFPEHVYEEIKACDLVVANVAPPRDWVRREVLEAIIHEKPLALVGSAGAPVPPELVHRAPAKFRHEVDLALQLYHGLRGYTR